MSNLKDCRSKEKSDCFTRHNSTVFKYTPIEREDIEYRLEVKNDDDLTFKVTSEKNVFITLILLF